MNAKLIEALQVQFNRERQNGAVYDALAGVIEKMNLAGLARFMARNADEERGHAKRFFDYIADIGEQPRVDMLVAQPITLDGKGDLFGDALQAFQFALAAERANLDALNALAEIADAATLAFLNPMLLGQVVSIQEFERHVTRLTLAQGNGAALLWLDHQLGEVKL